MGLRSPTAQPPRRRGDPLGGGALPSPLRSRHTLAYLFAAFALFAWQMRDHLGVPASAKLADPAATAVVFFESMFELSALAERPELELAARRESAQALERVRDELSELVRHSTDPERAAQLAKGAHELGIRALVLQLEAASAEEKRPLVDLLIAYARERRQDPLLDAVLRVHLPGGPDAPELELAEVETQVPELLFEAASPLRGSASGDLLWAGLHRADGQSDVAERIDEERAARAQGRRDHLQKLLAGAVAIFVLGGAAVVAFGVLGPAQQRLARAELPPGDSAALGLDLFARGLFGFQLFSVALGELLPRDQGSLLLGAAGLVCWLPLLVLTLRYLGPKPGRLGNTFGLRLSPGALGRLVPFALAVFAVQSVVFLLLRVLTGLAPMGADWASGATELWLLGDPRARAGLAVEAGLWAPLFEELAFRGLLFGALRTRMTFTGAALASSLLFAALHPYGPQGLVALTALGLVWCWSYERSGSLWPSILAHGLHNGASLVVLAVLR